MCRYNGGYGGYKGIMVGMKTWPDIGCVITILHTGVSWGMGGLLSTYILTLELMTMIMLIKIMIMAIHDLDHDDKYGYDNEEVFNHDDNS